MSTVILPYQASRVWLEEQIVSGRPLDSREHTLIVDLDDVSSSLAARAQRVRDSFVRVRGGAFAVFDSGLDPSRSFANDADSALTRMDEPVVAILGDMPETSGPTEDLDEVLSAWEDWLTRYREEALGWIARLNEWSPAYEGHTWAPKLEGVGWGSGVDLSSHLGTKITVRPDDGPKAMRDALAIELRDTWAERLFNERSVTAARQATASSEIISSAETPIPDLAAALNERSRRLYSIARAHHQALRKVVPDFDDEMNRWAAAHGSERLRLGLEDGYRMNARYLVERLAAEVPGFYAVPANDVGKRWATRAASPSRQALQLRRLVASAIVENAPKNLDGPPGVEIMVVRDPPHQIYTPDPKASDYPSAKGWPWKIGFGGAVQTRPPHPFEAVVVHDWLGRFHLLGAICDDQGNGPPGVWALPDPSHFGPDGSVVAQDPDGPAPPQAKKKPSLPEKADDDIPF